LKAKAQLPAKPLASTKHSGARRKRNLFPLQLFLNEILINSDTSKMLNQGAMPDIDFLSIDRFRPLVQYCTTVVATLPIVCAYPFLQKYFIKGVMIGSIKG
jgi:putative aldouronate transport system permease protein